MCTITFLIAASSNFCFCFRRFRRQHPRTHAGISNDFSFNHGWFKDTFKWIQANFTPSLGERAIKAIASCLHSRTNKKEYLSGITIIGSCAFSLGICNRNNFTDAFILTSIQCTQRYAVIVKFSINNYERSPRKNVKREYCSI